MTKCTKCIHRDLCNFFACFSIGREFKELESCKFFDENPVPCKVGDYIYRVWSCGPNGKSVAKFVITEISIDKEGKFIHYEGKMQRYIARFEDVGKTVFLSREDAVRAKDFIKLKPDSDSI